MIREGRVLSDSVLSAFCLPFPRAENREAVGKANVGRAVASDELALAAELDRLRAFGVAVVLPSGRVRELEGDGSTRDEEGVGVSRRVWTERRCLYRAFRKSTAARLAQASSEAGSVKPHAMGRG